MRKGILVVVALYLTWLPVTAIASNKVTAEMEKIAKQFTDDLKDRYEKQPTATVLPFQAEKKLSERGIGIAISEMLTAYLLNTKSFKIVERAEMRKVLEEQKLGLTGVIESNTAIAVGHLLGCQIVVAGNVIRLGENYQISARMIDVLTGEVLSVAFTEVDAESLDEQAKKYVVLVPEREAIGIYAGYFTSLIEGESIPHTDSVNTTVASDSFIFNNNFGLGVRYLPVKHLFADIFVTPVQTKTVYLNITPAGNVSNFYRIPYDVSQGNTVIASINYLYQPYERLGIFIGYGILYSSLKFEFKTNGITFSYSGYVANTTSQSKSKDFVLNTLITGLEYRPLQRFGISVSARYLQGKLPDMDMSLQTNPGGGSGIQLALFKPELHQFIYGLTSSLYF
jgi:TolB-like protein